MRTPLHLGLALAVAFSAGGSRAATFASSGTGTLYDSTPFDWGTLVETYQARDASSGWFYGSLAAGSNYFPSNADVANAGSADPQSLDPSAYVFTAVAIPAATGDTVLFHGPDGSYGALTLDSFANAPGQSIAVHWYYAPIPEPSTAWMLGLGLVVLGGRRRHAA